MIDLQDEATKTKVQTALNRYAKDEEKVKRMALYIHVAASELDDVDKVIDLAHGAMEQNESQEVANCVYVDGVCVNCGGTGSNRPGPCPTGKKAPTPATPTPRAPATPTPTPKPAKVATPAPTPTPLPTEGESDKVARAKAAHKMVDREVQRYAEEYNEPRFASVVGGQSFPDSEPVDVQAGGKLSGDGVELKTMVLERNKEEKITMDSYAQVRKILWEQEHGSTFHTVVSDDRQVYNALGSGEHDDSKRVYYYRRGVAGSARIDSLHKVESEDELLRLMALPESELPSGAQRTDGKLRVGEWTAITGSDGRKGFRNSETGKEFWAKK